MLTIPSSLHCQIVGRDMFSLSGGTRQGVTKVLILLTDGKCTLCGNKVSTRFFLTRPSKAENLDN